ncbi:MAG: hypothetical protein ACXABJ_02095, partial [Candidatus Heimdallarchaeaceae archaeon]
LTNGSTIQVTNNLNMTNFVLDFEDNVHIIAGDAQFNDTQQFNMTNSTLDVPTVELSIDYNLTLENSTFNVGGINLVNGNISSNNTLFGTSGSLFVDNGTVNITNGGGSFNSLYIINSPNSITISGCADPDNPQFESINGFFIKEATVEGSTIQIDSMDSCKVTIGTLYAKDSDVSLFDIDNSAGDNVGLYIGVFNSYNGTSSLSGNGGVLFTGNTVDNYENSPDYDANENILRINITRFPETTQNINATYIGLDVDGFIYYGYRSSGEYWIYKSDEPNGVGNSFTATKIIGSGGVFSSSVATGDVSLMVLNDNSSNPSMPIGIHIAGEIDDDLKYSYNIDGDLSNSAKWFQTAGGSTGLKLLRNMAPIDVSSGVDMVATPNGRIVVAMGTSISASVIYVSGQNLSSWGSAVSIGNFLTSDVIRDIKLANGDGNDVFIGVYDTNSVSAYGAMLKVETSAVQIYKWDGTPASKGIANLSQITFLFGGSVDKWNWDIGYNQSSNSAIYVQDSTITYALTRFSENGNTHRMQIRTDGLFQINDHVTGAFKYLSSTYSAPADSPMWFSKWTYGTTFLPFSYIVIKNETEAFGHLVHISFENWFIITGSDPIANTSEIETSTIDIENFYISVSSDLSSVALVDSNIVFVDGDVTWSNFDTSGSSTLLLKDLNSAIVSATDSDIAGITLTIQNSVLQLEAAGDSLTFTEVEIISASSELQINAIATAGSTTLNSGTILDINGNTYAGTYLNASSAIITLNSGTLDVDFIDLAAIDIDHTGSTVTSTYYNLTSASTLTHVSTTLTTDFFNLSSSTIDAMSGPNFVTANNEFNIFDSTMTFDTRLIVTDLFINLSDFTGTTNSEISSDSFGASRSNVTLTDTEFLTQLTEYVSDNTTSIFNSVIFTGSVDYINATDAPSIAFNSMTFTVNNRMFIDPSTVYYNDTTLIVSILEIDDSDAFFSNSSITATYYNHTNGIWWTWGGEFKISEGMVHEDLTITLTGTYFNKTTSSLTALMDHTRGSTPKTFTYTNITMQKISGSGSSFRNDVSAGSTLTLTDSYIGNRISFSINGEVSDSTALIDNVVITDSSNIRAFTYVSLTVQNSNFTGIASKVTVSGIGMNLTYKDNHIIGFTQTGTNAPVRVSATGFTGDTFLVQNNLFENSSRFIYIGGVVTATTMVIENNTGRNLSVGGMYEHGVAYNAPFIIRYNSIDNSTYTYIIDANDGLNIHHNDINNTLDFIDTSNRLATNMTIHNNNFTNGLNFIGDNFGGALSYNNTIVYNNNLNNASSLIKVDVIGAGNFKNNVFRFNDINNSYSVINGTSTEFVFHNNTINNTNIVYVIKGGSTTWFNHTLQDNNYGTITDTILSFPGSAVGDNDRFHLVNEDFGANRQCSDGTSFLTDEIWIRFNNVSASGPCFINRSGTFVFDSGDLGVFEIGGTGSVTAQIANITADPFVFDVPSASFFRLTFSFNVEIHNGIADADNITVDGTVLFDNIDIDATTLDFYVIDSIWRVHNGSIITAATLPVFTSTVYLNDSTLNMTQELNITNVDLLVNRSVVNATYLNATSTTRNTFSLDDCACNPIELEMTNMIFLLNNTILSIANATFNGDYINLTNNPYINITNLLTTTGEEFNSFNNTIMFNTWDADDIKIDSDDDTIIVNGTFSPGTAAIDIGYTTGVGTLVTFDNVNITGTVAYDVSFHGDAIFIGKDIFISDSSISDFDIFSVGGVSGSASSAFITRTNMTSFTYFTTTAPGTTLSITNSSLTNGVRIFQSSASFPTLTISDNAIDDFSGVAIFSFSAITIDASNPIIIHNNYINDTISVISFSQVNVGVGEDIQFRYNAIRNTTRIANIDQGDATINIFNNDINVTGDVFTNSEGPIDFYNNNVTTGGAVFDSPFFAGGGQLVEIHDNTYISVATAVVDINIDPFGSYSLSIHDEDFNGFTAITSTAIAYAITPSISDVSNGTMILRYTGSIDTNNLENMTMSGDNINIDMTGYLRNSTFDFFDGSSAYQLAATGIYSMLNSTINVSDFDTSFSGIITTTSLFGVDSASIYDATVLSSNISSNDLVGARNLDTQWSNYTARRMNIGSSSTWTSGNDSYNVTYLVSNDATFTIRDSYFNISSFNISDTTSTYLIEDTTIDGPGYNITWNIQTTSDITYNRVTFINATSIFFNVTGGANSATVLFNNSNFENLGVIGSQNRTEMRINDSFFQNSTNIFSCIQCSLSGLDSDFYFTNNTVWNTTGKAIDLLDYSGGTINISGNSFNSTFISGDIITFNNTGTRDINPSIWDNVANNATAFFRNVFNEDIVANIWGNTFSLMTSAAINISSNSSTESASTRWIIHNNTITNSNIFIYANGLHSNSAIVENDAT